MQKIHYGVIGLNFGRHHVRTLANMEEVELVAVADKTGDNLPGGLEGYAQKYGAKAYRDGLEMLANEPLDAVSICTSLKPRADLIRAALERNVALYIEKPWSTNVAHGRELLALCEGARVPVMSAFSFRYHPAIVKLRELMAGELGPALLLNGEYLFNWTPQGWLWDPEDGNGFFNENSCHLFDAVLSLLGEVEHVQAEAINPFGTPSEHAAAVTLRCKNGSIAALTIGGIAAGGFHNTPRIDLVTRNGQAHLEGRDHVWEGLSWCKRGEAEVHSLSLPPEQLGSTRYTNGLRHFIDCIRDRKTPQTGPQEGLRAVALAMAVYEAARKERS